MTCLRIIGNGAIYIQCYKDKEEKNSRLLFRRLGSSKSRGGQEAAPYSTTV